MGQARTGRKSLSRKTFDESVIVALQTDYGAAMESLRGIGNGQIEEGDLESGWLIQEGVPAI